MMWRQGGVEGGGLMREVNPALMGDFLKREPIAPERIGVRDGNGRGVGAPPDGSARRPSRAGQRRRTGKKKLKDAALHEIKRF